MIGIVIVTYNSWLQTEECLDSFYETLNKGEYRLYLVDNGSSIKPTKKVLDYAGLENVSLLRASENKGYSVGNNIGIRKALEDNCEFIVIANNDVVYKTGVIEKLLGYFTDKDVGIVAPKIFLRGEKLQECNMGCKMTLAGKYFLLLSKTPLSFISKKFVSVFRIDIKNIIRPIEVFSVSGCFLIFSRECLEKIGLFDEEMFLYEEENVLGVKLEANRLKALLIPEVSIIHNHGQTTKDLKALPYIWFTESEIIYLKKYLKKKNWQIWPLILIRKLVFFKRMIKNKDYWESRKNFKRRVKIKFETDYSL